MPKPPGSGRQKNTPNRVGKEARELAAKYTPKAFKRLGELAQHPDPKVAVLAIQQILDRRFGKPVAPTEISGPDGAPLHPAPAMSDFELANLVCFTLAKVAADTDINLARPAKAKAVTVEHAPDPFADQRAAQAAQIKAARLDEPAPYTDYAGAVAAQAAEDRLAIAECRQSRQVRVFVEPGGSAEKHGLATPRPNVVRFNPHRR